MIAMEGEAQLRPVSSAPGLLQRGDGRRCGSGRQVWIDTGEEPRPASAMDLDRPRPFRSEGAGATPGGDDRPGSRCLGGNSTLGSSCSSRPSGGRRFSPDELVCFRRVHTPSNSWEAKCETYFQNAGQLRKQATELGLASLPVLKGKFYSLPGMREQPRQSAAEKARLRREAIRARQLYQREEKLPDEDLTSAILNEIFPRSPNRKDGLRKVPELERPASCSALAPPGPESPVAKARSSATARETARTKAVRASGGTATPLNSSGLLGSSLKEAVLASPSNGEHGRSAAHRLSFQASVHSATIYELRKRVLEKYGTINEACEAFAEEFPSDRGMTKKEWRRVLNKRGFEWPNKEMDRIFEVLDIQNDGHVTLGDFHISVEAAAPVRSMEDLRRRWLASGYSSMAQAIKAMDDRGMSSRLSYEEFCAALRRVNVHDNTEHHAIFAGICSDQHGKVALDELMAAIATVSPDLLLEDVRQRLMTCYRGSLDKAYSDLDTDRGGTVEAKEFVAKSVKKLGFTEHEAKKAFRMIDIDGDGEISRLEFVSAVAIAEPSLFLEDLRLKIRRCFRSITEVLRKHFADELTGEIINPQKLSSDKFQDLLQPLDFKDAEVRALFNLIDTCREGELSVSEFVKGVQHFAPACALEDIRVRCIQRSSHVAETFKSISDKTKLLRMDDLGQLLRSVDIIDEGELRWKRRPRSSSRPSTTNIRQARVVVQEVFDLIDIANDGFVTLGRLVAALQCCGAGSRVRLSNQERDAQASRDMKDHLWPKHKAVNDLKTQVRLGLSYEEPKSRAEASMVRENSMDAMEAMGSMRQTSSLAFTKQAREHGDPKRRPKSGDGGSPHRGGSPTHAAQNASAADAPEPESQQPPAAGPAPRLKVWPYEDLASFMDKEKYHAMRDPDPRKPTQIMCHSTMDTWGGIWKQLGKAPPPDDAMRRRLECNLQSYFQAAAMSTSHDVPLVSGVSHSSMEQFRKMKAHKAALRMA